MAKIETDLSIGIKTRHGMDSSTEKGILVLGYEYLHVHCSGQRKVISIKIVDVMKDLEVEFAEVQE